MGNNVQRVVSVSAASVGESRGFEIAIYEPVFQRAWQRWTYTKVDSFRYEPGSRVNASALREAKYYAESCGYLFDRNIVQGSPVPEQSALEDLADMTILTLRGEKG